MHDEASLGSPYDAFVDTDERRQHVRRASRASIRFVVDTPELTGRAENVSPGGVLFFSQGDVRVTIEIEEQGTKRLQTGRLVRAQRMRGDQIGWAVEFDPS